MMTPAPVTSQTAKKSHPTMPPTTEAGRWSARNSLEYLLARWPTRSRMPSADQEVTTIMSSFFLTLFRSCAADVWLAGWGEAD
eukprot:scaffold2848_cov30-Tisochrysis_lutea.AAC.1